MSEYVIASVMLYISVRCIDWLCAVAIYVQFSIIIQPHSFNKLKHSSVSVLSSTMFIKVIYVNLHMIVYGYSPILKILIEYVFFSMILAVFKII